MKTCEALRSAGFHSVTTIEFRIRNINYAEVQLDVPDFGCNPAAPAAAGAKPSSGESRSSSHTAMPDGSSGAAAAGLPASTEGAGAVERGHHGTVAAGDGAAVNVADGEGSRVSGGNDVSKASEKAGLAGDRQGNGAVGDDDNAGDNAGDIVAACAESASPKENRAVRAAAAGSASTKRPREEPCANIETSGEGVGVLEAGRGRNERLPPKAAIRAAEALARKAGERKPPIKLVCAQPFPLMRGHTAFLTFAATPVARPVGPAVAAASDGAIALSAREARGGRVDGQNTRPGGGLGGESNHTGGGGSSGGTGSGSGGGGGGGVGGMDVCAEEGVAGEGKGKRVE